jgi:hypothetical protein
LRHVTLFTGGPFFPRREAVVLEPAFVVAGCEAAVVEPFLAVAGCEAVALGATAPFETPVFEGAAVFFVADAGDFATVFFAGVVLSALQPSAARAAMPAQHRMVRMSLPNGRGSDGFQST